MKKEEYKVLILLSAQRDLDDIADKVLLRRFKESMLKLKKEPRPYGSIKLLDQVGGHRIRVSNYRYCYSIDDENQTVFIYRVK